MQRASFRNQRASLGQCTGRLAKSRPSDDQPRASVLSRCLRTNSGHLGICTACPSTPRRTVLQDLPDRGGWHAHSRHSPSAVGKRGIVCASLTNDRYCNSASSKIRRLVDNCPGASMTIALQTLQSLHSLTAHPCCMSYSITRFLLGSLSCPPGRYASFVLRSHFSTEFPCY